MLGRRFEESAGTGFERNLGKLQDRISRIISEANHGVILEGTEGFPNKTNLRRKKKGRKEEKTDESLDFLKDSLEKF